MKSKPSSNKLFAIVIICALFSLSSQALWSQDFSSLDTDLQSLENLINDTIINTEQQQRLLQDLRANLQESETLIANYETTINEQEILLRNLREQLNEMSEIYRTQSALSARYERRLEFWRTFTLVGIPVTAVISGLAVWAIGK